MFEPRKCRGACGQWKAFELFATDPNSAGGRGHRCKACKNQAKRDARVSNKAPPLDAQLKAANVQINSAWKSALWPVFGGGFGVARISA